MSSKSHFNHFEKLMTIFEFHGFKFLRVIIFLILIVQEKFISKLEGVLQVLIDTLDVNVIGTFIVTPNLNDVYLDSVVVHVNTLPLRC